MVPVDSALVEVLRADEGLRSLVHGLALSDRFHFWMVVCDTPRIASAVLAILEEEVAAEREEPIRIVRLNPYTALTDPMSPIPFTMLVDEVLAKLVSPAPTERSPEVIFAVDATGALTQDDAAWAELFQRMNEQRNVIARAIAGQLLLLLPSRLEPVFARAAPDFWSIRSRAVVVQAEVERITRPVPHPEAYLPQQMEPPAILEGDPRQLSSSIEAARVSLKGNSEDRPTMAVLVVLLIRLAQAEMVLGKPADAQRAAAESVLFARRWVDLSSNDSLAVQTLCTALTMLARTWLLLDANDKALDAYQECIALKRSLIELEPQHVENRLRLAVVLSGIGDVLQKTGQYDHAWKAYEEGVSHLEHLLKVEPDHTQALWILAVTLVRMSDMLGDHGEIVVAIQAIRVSLDILQRLSANIRDQIELLHAIALNLTRLGRLLHNRGDLDHALDAHRKSIDNLRSLLQRAPARVEWLRDLTIALRSLGDVFTARGEPDRASACYDESAQIQRDLDTRAA